MKRPGRMLTARIPATATNLNTHRLKEGIQAMTKGKSTTKTATKGKAGDEVQGAQDAALASAILALAFRTKAERNDARKGIFQAGGVMEDIQDLASELAVNLIHPEVLPHALPVLLREARARVERGGLHWREVRALLLKLELAATEKGGAR